MMQKLFALILTFFTCCAFAQEPVSPVVTEGKPSEIYTVVEQMPAFPGGPKKMREFLRSNRVLPAGVLNGTLKGKTAVRFIVTPTGELSDIKVLKGVANCPECDAEAIRVVKSMPKWTPGKQAGKTVSVYYFVTVPFLLPADEELASNPPDKARVQVDIAEVDGNAIQVDAKPAVETNAVGTNSNQPILVVDEMPEFSGGHSALIAFIDKNLVLPKVIQDGDVQGKVYVRFIVTETGEVTEINVLRSLTGCKECDAEAIAVCKKMPKWKPGKQGGRPVKVFWNQPINFRAK